MSLAELKQQSVRDLRGEWSRLATDPGTARAQNTVLSSRASRALNVRFDSGRVIGRDGFVAGDMATGKMTAIYQWLSFDEMVGNINRIVTFEGGAIRMRDLIVGDEATAAAIAGAYSMTVVEAANRIYVALYTSDLRAATELRVIHPLVAGNPVDKAFMGPMSIVPTAIEAGAGDSTAGTHKLGYIVTSRSGFQGKPSPYMGGIFAPIEFTVAADKTIRMTINATWPSDAAFVSAVYTSIEHPEKYFQVPDTEIAVPGGNHYTVQIDISMSDDVLESSGTLLNDHFNYLTQMGGVGPMMPYGAAKLGTRLALFTGVLTYFSDQLDFETMSGSNHIVQLPGQRQVVTGFHIRGVHYLFGPKWTYGVVDNGGDPVDWTDPYSVSQALGTTAIHGVEGSTTGDMAWVANESGLWDFEGAYKAVPVSYMNDPHWKRINWGVARASIWIADDIVEQVVYVAVPLDNATDNSHLFAWSYARGRGPWQVDFSLYEIGGGKLSSVAMIRDWVKQRSKLWVGPDGVKPILIQDRDTVGHDNFIPFETPYETGEIFKRRQTANAVDVKMQTVEATVKGAGALRVKVFNKGRNRSLELKPVALKDLPGDHYQQGFYLSSPDGTVEFKTTGAGERMDLENFTMFYHPVRTNR